MNTLSLDVDTAANLIIGGFALLATWGGILTGWFWWARSEVKTERDRLEKERTQVKNEVTTLRSCSIALENLVDCLVDQKLPDPLPANQPNDINSGYLHSNIFDMPPDEYRKQRDIQLKAREQHRQYLKQRFFAERMPLDLMFPPMKDDPVKWNSPNVTQSP
jgi:hypothetical protein